MNGRIQDLYVEYGPVVYRRSLQILKNAEKAYDVTQEVFLKLLENDSLLERMRSPVSYLYRMSTNYSLNMLKKDRRQAPDTSIRLEDIPSGEKDGLSASMLLSTLSSHFNEKTRTIVYYRFVDGMTLEEIAEQMDMSLSGVRKQLDKFKNHVRNLKELIV